MKLFSSLSGTSFPSTLIIIMCIFMLVAVYLMLPLLKIQVTKMSHWRHKPKTIFLWLYVFIKPQTTRTLLETTPTSDLVTWTEELEVLLRVLHTAFVWSNAVLSYECTPSFDRCPDLSIINFRVFQLYLEIDVAHSEWLEIPWRLNCTYM